MTSNTWYSRKGSYHVEGLAWGGGEKRTTPTWPSAKQRIMRVEANNLFMV